MLIHHRIEVGRSERVSCPWNVAVEEGHPNLGVLRVEMQRDDVRPEHVTTRLIGDSEAQPLDAPPAEVRLEEHLESAGTLIPLHQGPRAERGPQAPVQDDGRREPRVRDPQLRGAPRRQRGERAQSAQRRARRPARGPHAPRPLPSGPPPLCPPLPPHLPGDSPGHS